MPNKVVFFPRNRNVVDTFRSGVSLHGHTKHSLESLGFLWKFMREHRFLRSWIALQARRGERESGIRLDLDRAYWTPPLTPELAYDVEFQQIESIGLRPLVSLSDHNNIAASTSLRLVPALADIPISVEWTVPFGSAVFHIGVHNLPSAIAHDLMSILAESTANADEQQITNLIAELQHIPSLLLVFNHPVWNFNGIAQHLFDFELRRFLLGAGRGLHAFELNGMRGHRENQKVIRLAAQWNHVVVSGGDRHACEPNAILNLTNAIEFPEFVQQVRNEKQSTVLMMSQYNEPLFGRFFRGFSDVIREYPEHPNGQRKWDERTFHPNLSGEVVPLNELWPNGSPGFLNKIFQLAIMASGAPTHWAMRTILAAEPNELLRLPYDFAPSHHVDPHGEQLGRKRSDQLFSGSD